MSTTALPSQSTDFPAWYGEVVRRAGLAENSSVRGAMVIKPHGYAIWEAIQRELDDRIKATGHENIYLPMLVPASVLAQEGELIEGFAPEVAVVTEAGGKKLEEPLAVRPTSEALIWSTYARWMQSYRDLPLLYNQWANAVRWELRPRLFLRTSEFLWQEGHTAHETVEEALAETLTVLHDVYADTIENVLAIPVLRGRKSESERFPGAVDTYTLEALMRDGKALQAATSHYLGQGFARAFDVRYRGRDGSEQYPYATSWGATTRLVGGVVMTHGDDRGLRLPPRVAPQQVVIVPIVREEDRADVLQAATAVADELRAAAVRVRVDDRPEYRPGYKFNEWELKGVPLRIEIGARDLAAGVVTVARRDTGAKQQIPASRAAVAIDELLDDMQASLFQSARDERERRTVRNPSGYEEMIEYLRKAAGFVAAPWCGRRQCEVRVKNDSSATIRCLPLNEQSDAVRCLRLLRSISGDRCGVGAGVLRQKPAPGAGFVRGERGDSNPRPPGPQPGALPAELRPPRASQCSRRGGQPPSSTRGSAGSIGIASSTPDNSSRRRIFGGTLRRASCHWPSEATRRAWSRIRRPVESMKRSSLRSSTTRWRGGRRRSRTRSNSGAVATSSSPRIRTTRSPLSPPSSAMAKEVSVSACSATIVSTASSRSAYVVCRRRRPLRKW